MITDLLKSNSYESLKNLECTHIGSNHIDKNTIINKVCNQALQARRLNTTLHNCLDTILQGGNNLRLL